MGKRLYFNLAIYVIATTINMFVSLILFIAKVKWADRFFFTMCIVFLIVVVCLELVAIRDEKDIKEHEN